MAAKRLGSALSDLEGTSKQLLRVKADESGFEFYTPASLPSYTVTNGTEDRTFDADETSIDEIADVLATLIDDIDTISGGPVAFQWSSSEQVYPFEKASDGSTLYCKEIDFGAGPNAGEKTVAHNISGLTGSKVHRYHANAYGTGSPNAANMLSQAHPSGAQYTINFSVMPTVVSAITAVNLSDHNIIAQIIYKK